MSSPPRPVTYLDKSDVLEALFAVWDDIDAVLDHADKWFELARGP